MNVGEVESARSRRDGQWLPVRLIDDFGFLFFHGFLVLARPFESARWAFLDDDTGAAPHRHERERQEAENESEAAEESVAAFRPHPRLELRREGGTMHDHE